MQRPRLSGTDARRIRRRLWHAQRRCCFWCEKTVILPEELLREYLPLDSIYEEGFGRELPSLHQQLMDRVPEFKRRWLRDLATLDHLIEIARGGSDDEDNLVVACAPCNAARGEIFHGSVEVVGILWLESAGAANETSMTVPSGSVWPPN